jgi:hypothetical protein
MGDGDKWIEMVYSEEKIFFTGLVRARQDKNLLYQHDKSNNPTKEWSLSYVLFESPVTSVSTVSRGQPSLFSLLWTMDIYSVIDLYETYSFIFLSAEQAYKRIQIPMTIDS